MKTKNSVKKLKLNKTTISDLRSEDLQDIRAGYGITYTACPSKVDTGCISFCGSVWPCSL